MNYEFNFHPWLHSSTAISKAVEMPGAEDHRGLNRQKRATQTKQADVTIELAIVCDAAATEYYNKTGAKSEVQMIEGVLMKWYGVSTFQRRFLRQLH